MSRLLRALLFSLLCILPQLTTLATHGIYDPRILEDWDEPFYLPQPKDFSSLPLLELLRVKDGNLAIFSHPEMELPHNLLDVMLAKLSPLLSPPQLGLLLDFISCCLIFLLGSALFDLIGNRCWHSEIGALVLIKLPWLLSIEEMLRLPLFGQHVITWAHDFFPNQPAFRAVYTQLGMIGFLTGILLFTKLVSNPEKLPKKMYAVALGALNALLLYIYFFAWASLICVVGIASATLLWQHRRALSVREIFAPAFFGLLANLIISLPGLAHFFRSGSLYAPGPGADFPRITDFLDFSQWWCLPPITLAFSIFLGYRLYQKRAGLITLLLFSLLATVPILMNIQGILGRWITPYHFPLFFIHPLVSGIGIVAILGMFKRNWTRVMLSGCIVLTLAADLLIAVQRAESPITPEGTLLKYLGTSVPPGASIATMPFHITTAAPTATLQYMLLPYWIKTFTTLQPYSQFMSFNPDRSTFARKELTLNLLFRGEVSPIIPCPEGEQARVSASDVLLGATAYHQAQRLVDCSVLKQMVKTSTACELISQRPIDFVIWESTFDFSHPRWYSSFAHLQWQSPDERYSIYQIDYAALRTYLCTDRAD